jgi:hypothetical protein
MAPVLILIPGSKSEFRRATYGDGPGGDRRFRDDVPEVKPRERASELGQTRKDMQFGRS